MELKLTGDYGFNERTVIVKEVRRIEGQSAFIGRWPSGKTVRIQRNTVLSYSGASRVRTLLKDFTEREFSQAIEVDGTPVEIRWEDNEGGVIYIEFHWPEKRNNDFSWIAQAEEIVTRTVAEQMDRNLQINGGTGSIGYRAISGDIR